MIAMGLLRFLRVLASKKAAPAEIFHQGSRPERPGLALIAGPHAVDELSELRRGDRHDVPDLVSKTHPRGIAILDRREHRAEKQDGPVRVLVMRPHHLRDKILRIAAD